MKTLKIIIEKSSDHFSAYGQNCKGLYGAGNSPGEVKENILEALQLIKESESCPAILKTPLFLYFSATIENQSHASGVFKNPFSANGSANRVLPKKRLHQDQAVAFQRSAGLLQCSDFRKSSGNESGFCTLGRTGHLWESVFATF